MAVEVRLPRFGETMNEATIVDCKVKPGDRVKSGDVLFEIETDKATLEMESPADGYVRRVLAEQGLTYRVGATLLVLGGKDEQINEQLIRSLTPRPVPEITEPPERPDDADVSPAPLTKTAPQPVGLGRTIPVNRPQKVTAQKMLRSKREIPCFYLTVRTDVTDLADYRTKLNQTSETAVSYNDFIIKAVATALRRFPIMTGQLEGDNIKLAGTIGIGLAIEVPQGLVAPVVKGPDKMTVVEIARYAGDLADRAKNNRLTLEDLEGGCITVSNLGAMGIDYFIPIVVPGQCSILGVGRIKNACIPDDGGVAIRRIMTMTLSVDHRIANGSYAAQFLDFIKKLLEDPAGFKYNNR